MARPKISISESDLEEKLIPRLDHMTNLGIEYKGGWDQQHDKHWKYFLQQPESEVKTWPWPNACNFMSPMVTVAVDSLNSLYYDAMLTTRPQLIGHSDLREDETRLLEEFFFDFVWKKQISMELFGDNWNFNTSIDGTSVAGYRWDNDLTVVRTDEVSTDPITERITEPFMGEDMDVEVITGFNSNIEERVRAEKAGRPVIDVLDMGNLYIAPGTKRSMDLEGSLQWPNCSWYFIDSWKSEEQARQMSSQGSEHLKEEDIEVLLSEKELTDRERTQHQHDKLSQIDPRKILFRIFFMRLVLPGKVEYPDGETKGQTFDSPKGVAEECIVWYLPKSKKISMIMPLSRMYPDNRRPHVDNHHVMVGNFFFSMGVPALLEQVMKLDTSATRQMVDYGALVNKPWAFYEPARTGLLPSMQSIQPGALIAVENAAGVKVPSFAKSHDFWQTIRVVAQEWQERLSNVTDFIGGRNASLPNSPRTFRGQATMLQQANIAFAHRVALRAVGFRIMMRRVKNLYHRNAPPEIEFNYFNSNTGIISNKTISRELLKHDFEFSFKLNPNRALEGEQAQNRLALVMSMPWLGQDPEIARNAMSDVYKAEGKLDDFNSRIWPQDKLEVHIQQTQQQQQQQIDPQTGQPMPGAGPPPVNPQMFQGAGQGQPPGLPGPQELPAPPPEEEEESLEDLAVNI